MICIIIIGYNKWMYLIYKLYFRFMTNNILLYIYYYLYFKKKNNEFKINTNE